MAQVDAAGAGIWASEQLFERSLDRSQRGSEPLDGPHDGGLGALLRQCARLGVDAPLASSRQWLARALALGAWLRTQRAQAEKNRYQTIVDLAEGKANPGDDGVAASLDVYRRVRSNGVLASVVASAQVHCRGMAETEAARAAAGPLWTALAALAEASVDTSAKLAAGLPAGVVDDASLLKASRKQSKLVETWSQLGAAVNTFTGVHEVAAGLRELGWAARLGRGDGHPLGLAGTPASWLRYTNPTKLPKNYMNEFAPELRLAVARAAGAGPGLYDAADADRRYRSYMARQARA